MATKVTRDWAKVLTEAGDYKKIIAGLDTYTPKDPFAFAQYSFKRIKIVILGQDPYPNPGDADGLAFSYSGEGKIPSSLGRIFTVLEKSGKLAERPKSGCLKSWARQGILLLNTSLTCEPGKPRSHSRLWEKFVNNVIRAVSDKHKDLIWLLWGNDAISRRELIDPRHTVLTHCHPVAMQTPSFSECDHFIQVAKKYPNIIWSPDPVDTDWFTDGTCKGNQYKKVSQSGYGVVCTKGPLAGQKWYGPTTPGADGKPTNIRAEGLAILTCLKRIIRSGVPGTHTIHTDSQFWIDMIHEYMPNWRKSGVDFASRKNPDLTTAVYKTVKKARKIGNVQFKYVKAWHNYEPTADTEYFHIGNKLAELAAELG